MASSASRRFDMRFPPRNKISAAREREERLRQARLNAHALRDVFPSASLVTVQLTFLPATAPPHAAQSFALYPPARAVFLYRCPYGDCDGIYDLTAEADRALGATKGCAKGVLECGGVRAREVCRLRLSYTIAAARHE
jgi:hypothetical protein